MAPTAAEQALEEVKDAGVRVREAVETDLEDAAEMLRPNVEPAAPELPDATESQAGSVTP